MTHYILIAELASRKCIIIIFCSQHPFTWISPNKRLLNQWYSAAVQIVHCKWKFTCVKHHKTKFPDFSNLELICIKFHKQMCSSCTGTRISVKPQNELYRFPSITSYKFWWMLEECHLPQMTWSKFGLLIRHQIFIVFFIMLELF